MINIKAINNGKLIPGDCQKILKSVPSNSIDQLITDPPYGYSFMGKNWDKALPDIEIFEECLRVLKPGAFAFVMAAPRQDVLSRMMVMLEDAGFKTDLTSIYWTYATGFPKAQDIGKVIDKKLGKDRDVIGTRKQHDIRCNGYASKKSEFIEELKGPAVSGEAKQFEGSYGGFQPKPAVEVIIVVQKPGTESTQVGQALDNGHGVTWLDDCRIPYVDGDSSSAGNRTATFGNQETISGGDGSGGWEICKEGRLPANLLVSDDVLDDGKSPNQGHSPKSKVIGYGKSYGGTQEYYGVGGKFKNKGNYSRFFSLDTWAQRKLPFMIVPKASKKEKDAGCESLHEHNSHPTVKPIKLMSYLITMGSREGDIVLDPFCGSGTTGVAAMLLGRKFICIERKPEYHKIAKARLQSFADSIEQSEKPEAKPIRKLSEIESITLSWDRSIIEMKAVPSAIDHAFNNRVEKSVYEGVTIDTTFTKDKPIKPKKEKDNVQDWADKGINISKGCSNNCLYCYAREESVRRHGNVYENWANEQLNERVIKKGWRLSSKRLMFPTTHDITPGTYDACETVLKKLLEAGNQVLVVSKPRVDLIEKLCDSLEQYKDRMMFRFTISARDNKILSFWEPNAPSYEDRVDALTIAHAKGFMTSVSIEPMLDPADIKGLVEDLRSFTSDSMWIGPVKMIRKRTRIDSDEIEREVQKIEVGQTPEKLLKVYELFKDDPLIKWKGHFRKLLRKVGVEVPEQNDDWRDLIKD